MNVPDSKTLVVIYILVMFGVLWSITFRNLTADQCIVVCSLERLPMPAVIN